MLRKKLLYLAASLWVLGVSSQNAHAQYYPPGVKPPAGFKLPEPTPDDALGLPTVSSDGRITFRLYAPKADGVNITSDALSKRMDLVKDEQGVWSLITDPVPPGTYRYIFNVDGTNVVDPHNPETSPGNGSLQSLVRVAGAG